MAKVVLFMAMSLDGFIAGPEDSMTEPAGREGERLFAWSDGGTAARAVHGEYNATGAVLSGRRTYDLVNGWSGDHHDGVPMFILTHKPPLTVPEGKGTYTFVTDGVESAVAQAKAAAADKEVLLHGADIAQQCLRLGLLDEMVIHLIPVLLGEGRRLFEHLGSEHVELKLVHLREAPQATHLRYRVVHAARAPE
jgi:dihydrofolate reductase